MENKLFGKTIIWNGDSICQGGSDKGNWATRIAAKNSMLYKNYAVGGGTVAENLPKTKNGNERHSVSKTLERMYEEYPDADYVIFDGGTNDADLLGNEILEKGNTRLGNYDATDFSGEYDKSTFTGALESLFYRATKYWSGKKIGFIIAQKMKEKSADWDIFNNRRLYFDRAAEICKKWGIPYIDLWNTCYLNPMLPWMFDQTKTKEEIAEENVCFYVDGQHLSSRGYDFTADIINSWLLTL